MASTPYVTSIPIDAVITALGGFIQPMVGTIIRGQINRVAMPADGFVELTELLMVDLETPTPVNYGANAQMSIMSPKRIDIQIDFYGPSAGDWCTAVQGIWRTEYAVAQFPAGIAPLFCTDGLQGVLTNAEAQYENRWSLTASLQFNPVVYFPQQFATAASLKLVADLL